MYLDTCQAGVDDDNNYYNYNYNIIPKLEKLFCAIVVMLDYF